MLTGPGPMGEPSTSSSSAWKGWRSLLIWMGVALLLRWAVIEPRWIPSGSMLPTLQLQDRVLVEKIRPHLQAGVPTGSIVVFRAPDALVAAGYDPKAALIKRVVAQAGDQVQVHKGQLLRNGAVTEEPWLAEAMTYEFGPIRIPPGHLLVLGDNRNASLDSHLWGPLPETSVLGTAVFRYWPLNRLGPIRFSTHEPADPSRQLG